MLCPREIAGIRQSAPPMLVPWPPRYFVNECTTMSAPCSKGRLKYGGRHRVVDNQGHAVPMGDRRNPLESVTLPCGFPVTPDKMAFVFSSMSGLE